MTARKKAEANLGCPLCKGKGWYRASNDWPTQCHQCFPSMPRPASGPPRPAPKQGSL